MVKNLYLLRHGHAETIRGTADFDRRLSETGHRQLSGLGTDLRSIGFNPDKIYCSPSKRTIQTTEIVLGALELELPVFYEEGIYEASLRSLLTIVMKTEDAITDCLLIGHNPGISYLFDYLIGSGFRSLAPGEIVAIEFEDLTWSELSKGTGMEKALLG